MKNILYKAVVLAGVLVSSLLHAQPEYRVKSIAFSANTPAGFQAGKSFTATYEFENVGNATGFDIQFFSYFSIDELGLQWGLLFDGQVIPEFPAGAVASISYEIETQTSANYVFGGTINGGVNLPGININIGSKPEQNPGDTTRNEVLEVFCEGSILNLNNQVITEDRPIIGDEITAGSISILPGGKVNINGGNTVHLIDGFHAREGSTVLTRIGDCRGFAGGRVASNPDSGEPLKAYETGVVTIKKVERSGVDILDIQVYPNPTTDHISIAVPTDRSVRELVLYNQSGRVVNNKRFETNQEGIEDGVGLAMENLPTGVYLLQVTLNDGSILSKKVVKE